MKSAILYSQLRPASGYTEVKAGDASIYVRAEVVKTDVSQALDQARPLVGEIVLNSIPLSE